LTADIFNSTVPRTWHGPYNQKSRKPND